MILYFVRAKVDSDKYIRYCINLYLDANGLEKGNFEIVREDGKKPRLSREDVKFSLSHTNGVTLVAVSDEEIGADIEKIRPIEREKFASFIDAKDEVEFFEQWTMRESYAKYTGDGIAVLRHTPPETAHFEQFKVYGDEYAVCVCAKPQNIVAYDMSPDWIE